MSLVLTPAILISCLSLLGTHKVEPRKGTIVERTTQTRLHPLTKCNHLHAPVLRAFDTTPLTLTTWCQPSIGSTFTNHYIACFIRCCNGCLGEFGWRRALCPPIAICGIVKDCHDVSLNQSFVIGTKIESVFKYQPRVGIILWSSLHESMSAGELMLSRSVAISKALSASDKLQGWVGAGEGIKNEDTRNSDYIAPHTAQESQSYERTHRWLRSRHCSRTLSRRFSWL